MSEIEVSFSWRWRWWARPYVWATIVLVRLGFVRPPTREQLRKLIIVTIGALLLLGCPQPQQPPNPDASDAQALGDVAPDAGDVCALACANLAALGCVEGGPRCLDVCQHDQAQPVTVLPLACWANAPTKEAARACGSATSGHLECR